MTAPVKLRPAHPADAAAIARVQVETWRAAYAGIVPDAYLVSLTESKQALQWNHTIRRAVAPETVLAAESADLPGGRIVGFGSCGRGRGSGGGSGGEIFPSTWRPTGRARASADGCSKRCSRGSMGVA